MNRNPLVAMTPAELRALARDVKNRELRFSEIRHIERDAIVRGLLLLAILMEDQLDKLRSPTS